jgi:hypothetical protein
MTDDTAVTRGVKKVTRAELKPGLRVIVLALGHDMFDLEAFEIQIRAD